MVVTVFCELISIVLNTSREGRLGMLREGSLETTQEVAVLGFGSPLGPLSHWVQCNHQVWTSLFSQAPPLVTSEGGAGIEMTGSRREWSGGSLLSLPLWPCTLRQAVSGAPLWHSDPIPEEKAPPLEESPAKMLTSSDHPRPVPLTCLWHVSTVAAPARGGRLHR